jgi:RNA polymerase sigma-70 factor (ECF subfamily)
MLRAARVRRLALLDWSSRQVESSGRPDDYPSLDETGVLEKVMALPVKYREVIVLRYYHDLDTQAIARILRVSENTVKTRLRRAKDRLRRSLAE